MQIWPTNLKRFSVGKKAPVGRCRHGQKQIDVFLEKKKRPLREDADAARRFFLTEHKGVFLEHNGFFLEHDGVFLETNSVFLEHNGVFLEHNEVSLEHNGVFLQHNGVSWSIMQASQTRIYAGIDRKYMKNNWILHLHDSDSEQTKSS